VSVSVSGAQGHGGEMGSACGVVSRGEGGAGGVGRESGGEAGWGGGLRSLRPPPEVGS
jgi:hypothetical protein